MGLLPARLDEFASRSHELAAAAIDGGAFDAQIIPVTTPTAAPCGRRGGAPRHTPETLQRLKPSFSEDGVIHAGNSSQISDGAAALLVTTPEKARRARPHPDRPLPLRRGRRRQPGADATGPIPATQKLLKRSGVAIDEIGVFEVNEAFAPVPLAWLAETGADRPGSTPSAARSRSATRSAPPGRPDDPDDQPHARPRSALRPADDVRGRRHRQRDAARAGHMSQSRPSAASVR